MMCLVSPVTWVHHLVWLIPGLILLVDNAMAAPARGRRRRLLLAAAIIGYGFLISRIVWAWEKDFTGVDGFLGSNTYVWISLALLLGLPIRSWATPAGAGPDRQPEPAGSTGEPVGSVVEPGGVAQLDQPERVLPAGERHRVDGLRPVG